LTDKAIVDILGADRTEIVWEPNTFLPFHPNGMKFEGLTEGGTTITEWEVYSIGGGFLSEGLGQTKVTQVAYPYTTMDGILKWYGETGRIFWEYVLEYEGQPVFDHLREVWAVMRDAVERGLEAEGVLPGGLGLQRKASAYYRRAERMRDGLRGRGLLFAYALAVSEENAAGTGLVVTAPTCGSAGVLPAVLYYLHKHHEVPEKRIIRALATAGLIGAIVKHNASISGAEVGCQGEIGVACAMAAAAVNQIFGGSPNQIEYAAEMGLEHHLGLTCDPVCGLVQIPCIERNAFAAARAMDANMYASLSDGRHNISFDKVVKTMLETGHDLPSLYKETSTGGLAKD
jgi:L-serine dehydratase